MIVIFSRLCHPTTIAPSPHPTTMAATTWGDGEIRAICWWLVGFGLAFGDDAHGFIGTSVFALHGGESRFGTSGLKEAEWVFDWAFAGLLYFLFFCVFMDEVKVSISAPSLLCCCCCCSLCFLHTRIHRRSIQYCRCCSPCFLHTRTPTYLLRSSAFLVLLGRLLSIAL